LTRDQIAAYPDHARKLFGQIKDNIHIMDIHGWTLSDVSGYVEKIKPDVTIIDQFDKLALSEKYDSGHERLRALYIGGRSMAKDHDTALIAVCQASADAEGRTILTPDMMEGSKTGKYAEGDLIIGIGKHPDSPDGNSDPIRYLTVNKNKLNGFHGTITCKIEPELSRYVD